MHRRSIEVDSEASYCERETWDDWGSRSSLSHVEEVASENSGRDDVTTLRAERDALARALAAERQRAATAARAHDARLAELHGVIAELVRRRAAHKQTAAIPEEELSDECESTTQPAGELDNDADNSRTEQNDTSSALSPSELPTPQEPAPPPPTLTAEDTECVDTPDTSPGQQHPVGCCGGEANNSGESVDSCERERGSPALYANPPAPTMGSGGCQTKLASRVRLRRATDTQDDHADIERCWCADAERLSLEAAYDDSHDTECIWRARWLRAEAARVAAGGALSRCAETARRLHCACAQLEAAAAAMRSAVAAADRATEAYDVLLALAETQHTCGPQREAAEAVAWRLLRRLSEGGHEVDSPTLSPGPWLHHDCAASPPAWEGAPPPWGEAQEAALRARCAALKAHSVALRQRAACPALYSHHDIDEDEIPRVAGVFSMADMEAAVMLEEMLTIRVSNMERAQQGLELIDHKTGSSRSRRRRERQRRPHAAETDL